MSRKPGLLRISFEVIVLAVFFPLMFSISFIVGVFYCITILISLWKGLIFKRKNIAWMIILGTLLSYLAGLLLPYIIGSYLTGDIISAVIIFLIAFVIWLKGRKLKQGKR